ncbi:MULTISPECIES: MazG nucleotide pyrophosphohydrolase domain-containing protein [Pasteurellaceae]|uniref:MazG-like family protein n=1 Tax=Pasteurella atlantica TaxID=2827233 RepID=A0AAW8CJV0_9PAST|nr:MazG-like family protein [Pasteurella atlantica]MBR0572673.1 MazG-like family protein [Pasteurella atlantica]MDP8038618.1 MazG-like family protein [Pasteurella atlantica]MDP8040710.1 MazG-like family protein [Pasteurella atlantica]MDP8042845.1 MazG-like family protein [Pasteurella atlantica]MDP8044932.1 MazG-like family protein [Pasteurella atlantica]
MLIKYQKWVKSFYLKRGWYNFNSSIRLNFLMEEVGELSQAIRRYEIGRDRPDEVENKNESLDQIKEELGDVLDNIMILVDKYDFNINDIINEHIEKIEKRYK